MEWRRIEEKWLEMTVKLQAGPQGATVPGINAGGAKVETQVPKDDSSPVLDGPNARMIA